MKKTIFNTNKVEYKDEPMFFGQDMNLARFDTPPRPIFEKLNKHMMELFWASEEINLTKDIGDWKEMSEAEQFIFIQNLSYQTVLDSVQGRSPALLFLPYCSDPSLEACISTWNFFEGSIHARSYAYIMRNLVHNPEKVFDEIMDNEEIVKRGKLIASYLDDYLNYAQRYHVANEGTMRELKRKLYLALVMTNILEGVSFYTSFACSFALAENKKMEGSAKIITLIARDESQHLAITQHIIKQYIKEDPEMVEIMKEEEETVYKMYRDAVDGEKSWAKHLFKKGTVIGLNEEILGKFIEHIANKRLKAIGLDTIFEQAWNKNPLPWFDRFVSSKNVQQAPQEVSIISYLGAGAMDNNFATDDYEEFEL